jgi:hypothetical protein
MRWQLTDWMNQIVQTLVARNYRQSAKIKSQAGLRPAFSLWLPVYPTDCSGWSTSPGWRFLALYYPNLYRLKKALGKHALVYTVNGHNM